jgi:histidyl-tRNA synthetase
MFTRVKGTQDFLDMTLFNFLIDQARKHLVQYHFGEISTPILEYTELFKRTLGSETDVVSKEMFIIKTQEGDESICLRPEATASTVRAFVDAGIQTIPWKVFSWGSMFRYERPQKGRFREFHQLNIEIIGTNSIYQDAHFIKMLERFFHEKLNIDNYALLLNFLGCAQDRIDFKKLLTQFLETVSEKLCTNCTERKEKNILRIFDCKNPNCQELYKNAPKIAENLCAECNKEWQILKNELEHLSVSYSYAPNLVRGLDYYDKTVFEFVSTSLGAQNAFCGGGRYNQLAKLIGSKEDQPSLGVAMGIERLLIILQEIKDTLAISQLPKLQVILPLSEQEFTLALLVADELQAHGLCVDILLEGHSLKSMMRTSNKMGAQHSIIIGDTERKEGTVVVKNMVTGAEEKVLQRDLVKFLKH